MTIRKTPRDGRTVLVIDILYRSPEGRRKRYRRDAQVQTMTAARQEELRLLRHLVFHESAGPTTSSSEATGAERKGPTFEEAVTHFRATKLRTNLKPSTRRGYNFVLDALLLPEFGKKKLVEIDRKLVAEFDAELVDDGMLSSTRRNIHCVLRSVLRGAADDGLLDVMPILPRLPKVGRTAMKVVKLDELDDLFKHAANFAVRLAFGLAAYAGLRASEVRGLRWSDVDLDACTITVRRGICRGEEAPPKSGHQRVLPIAVPLLVLLETAKKIPHSPWGPVAPSSRGTIWSEFGLRSAYRDAASKASISGRSFHSLRHFFVTELFRQGASAPTVQALAGHCHLSVTQRYAHTNEADLKAAIAKLGGNGVETKKTAALTKGRKQSRKSSK